MIHRREIDGLRAVAVLPIVLFHAGVGPFAGGFIGVDVFFVISGYLITSILVKDLEAGDFSIRRFYERRARRILPALFVVLAATVPAAWRILPPVEMEAFAKSLSATLLFVSNIVFWLQDSYFDTAAELKPLLHTWSLSVEEQFYLLFPLLLCFLWRWGRQRLVLAIGLLAIASLAFSDYASQHHPTFNFFWSITRAWELFAGALCALAGSQAQSRRANAASAVGLAMILGSVLLFTPALRHPSILTLIPVLGTCLVLAYGVAGTHVARLLSAPLLVGVGLISYSLYLWHQPLLVFGKLHTLGEIGRAQTYGLLAASFALAALSWRFVEQPFRDARRVPARMFTPAVGLAASLLLAAGLVGQITAGLPNREAGLDHLSDRLHFVRGLDPACDFAGRFVARPECSAGARPEVLLWGDSFAMQLAPALQAAHPNLGFVQATKVTCGPFEGVALVGGGRYTIDWARDCVSFNESVLAYLKATPSIRHVVISSALFQYLGDNSLLIDGAIASPAPPRIAARLLQAVRAVQDLGRSVILVAPPPAAPFNMGQCLVSATMLRAPLSRCDFPQGSIRIGRELALADDLRREGVDVRDPRDFLCGGGVCKSAIGGVFIYRDYGHLSLEGARYLGRHTRLFDLD